MDNQSSPRRQRGERKRTKRKEARPGELVAAALDLFVERGFAATRIDDVAARAGASKGTAYLYFPTKEDLFKAVIRSSVVPRIALSMDAIARFEGSAEDLLRTIVTEWLAYQATPQGAVMKLVVSEARNFPELATFYLEEVILPGRRFVADIIRRGVESGEFRPVDPETTAPVVFAPLSFFNIWKHSLGPYDPSGPGPETFAAAYLDFAIAGLRAPAADRECG